MLTIGAASLLFIFVVPWIRDMMDNGKMCSDARGQITIELGKYTCFDSTSGDTTVMITMGEKRDIQIEGISVSLRYSGTSQKFDIKNGTSISGVEMYNGESVLSLPDSGGSETYRFKGITGTELATAALIFKGDKLCDAVSEKIVDCRSVQ